MTEKEKRKHALRAVKENFIWTRILLVVLGIVALPLLGNMSVDAMSSYAHSQNANVILLSLWGTLNVGSVVLFLACVWMLGVGISEIMKVYRHVYGKCGEKPRVFD